MFVKVTNGVPEIYTLGQFRRDHSATSFPKVIPEETLAEYGVYPLTAVEQPEFNPLTHQAVLSIEQADGVWTYVWTVAVRPISAQRADAVLPKAEFCLAVFTAGLLDAETAEAAARGEWPAEFDSALVGLPANEVAAARTLWAAAGEVRRNHPLFDLLIGSELITDAQADAVFGLVQS